MSSHFTSYPSLRGKVALVTGGGAGIGAAIVEQLVAQGCRTAFVDIDSEAAERLNAQLRQRHDASALFISCDLTDLDALALAIEQIRAVLGDIDILVNNAAHDARHTIESVTARDWDDKVAVNLRHYFFAIQAVLPQMMRRGGGSIMNFSSTSYKIKNAGYPLYAMCKAAAHGLTRSMARDLGRHAIRINTVTPGWVMTERQLREHMDEGSDDLIAQNQCMPGKVMPADLAAMVLFLAADDSRMCTAQEFVVDAGWT